MPAFSKALDLQVREIASLFSTPSSTSFPFTSSILGHKGRSPMMDGQDGVAMLVAKAEVGVIHPGKLEMLWLDPTFWGMP